MSPVRNKDYTCKKEISNGVKILVVAGLSAGHIFPALGFLDALKDKPNIEALLVLPKKNAVTKIGEWDYNIKYISLSSIRNYGDTILNFRNSYYGIKYCVPVIQFFKGALESLFILADFKPDVVVGFGSLASVPILILAWLFRIHTIIHEQNVIPGKANKFLSKFADKIALSFSATKDYLGGLEEKIVFTGNPLRLCLARVNKKEALAYFGFSGKFTILVMGGSLGAHKINIEFLNTVSRFADKQKIQVIHLSGLQDYDLLKNSYASLGINVKLYSFFKQMQYAYSASDLVLSRAGASTIAELLLFRLPAILIPYPYAYKHQLSNAKVLEKINSALIIEDGQLDSGILKHILENFIKNPDRLKSMRLSYSNIAITNANDALVNSALSFITEPPINNGHIG